MTSSGLGWTDIGNPKILGGLSREFYQQIGHYYSKAPPASKKTKAVPAAGQSVAGAEFAESKVALYFEPKVAESVFDAMVKEAKVQVIHGRLDLTHRATKSGVRIDSIQLEDGTTIRGRMFNDASYEGDLLAAAGVSASILFRKKSRWLIADS